jgi:Holliday junction resolvase
VEYSPTTSIKIIVGAVTQQILTDTIFQFLLRELYIMANKNGRKGSQFETDVMKWLRGAGVMAERLTKAGAKDEGDLVTVVAGETYILELKNRQTLSLPEFWREAQVEALNYAKARGLGEVPLSYVVVKRRNASIDQAWVIQDLNQWLKEKK